MTDDRIDNNEEPLIAIVAAGLVPVMLNHLQDSLGQMPSVINSVFAHM